MKTVLNPEIFRKGTSLSQNKFTYNYYKNIVIEALEYLLLFVLLS
ncbi:MAG: hypothetical protein ACI9SJ_001859 [Flavobacteriaceae bacterium]|jgi:hypothetical protein